MERYRPTAQVDRQIEELYESIKIVSFGHERVWKRVDDLKARLDALERRTADVGISVNDLTARLEEVERRTARPKVGMLGRARKWGKTKY